MVQLVEITGVLNEKGCIEIPIVLLAQTGIRTGEEVNLIYLAAGEKDYRNESREFMLKRFKILAARATCFSWLMVFTAAWT